MTCDDTTEPVVEARREVGILVVGVGGAGCNAVEHLARKGLRGVEFLAANTDTRALSACSVERKASLGAGTTRGLGAGGDPVVGREAAEEAIPAIRAACTGAQMVLIVAGLGGGTGTGAAPVVARIAREGGALVLGVVILPFECEGGRRLRQAQFGLHELRQIADGVICLPNDRMSKLTHPKSALVESFEAANELIAQALEGIWRLLTCRGVIQVDFADLRAVAQGRHSESCLASAEARGEHRAREVVEKLMAHPLIDGPQDLNDWASALVSVAAGPGLALSEVTYVMDQIRRHCDHAHLILGAAEDESLEDRLVVTVVASHRALEESSPVNDLSDSLPVEAPAAQRTDSEDVANVRRGDGDNCRTPSSLIPPPPNLSQERAQELWEQQAARGTRQKKRTPRLRQTTLDLQIVPKGRFEKSEPTRYNGQDLDVPTFIRRGIGLS